MEINPKHRSILSIGHAIERSNESFLSVYKAKQRIDVHNNNNLYFLSKGNVAAYSFGGEVLVFNVFAPEIICLEKIKGFKIINHLRCVTDAEIHAINVSDAIDILNKFDLWHCAFDVVIRYLGIYHGRDNKLTQPTSRDTIIQYVKYIWGFDPSQRAITSIYIFILERTHISRSFIHKVISELESQELVIVQRGILMQCKIP